MQLGYKGEEKMKRKVWTVFAPIAAILFGFSSVGSAHYFVLEQIESRSQNLKVLTFTYKRCRELLPSQFDLLRTKESVGNRNLIAYELTTKQPISEIPDCSGFKSVYVAAFSITVTEPNVIVKNPTRLSDDQ